MILLLSSISYQFLNKNFSSVKVEKEKNESEISKNNNDQSSSKEFLSY
jgi:hypothetical protein